MSDNPFDPAGPQDLPSTLPVFPLAGATLLPRTQLPLNIFEPRYLDMVLDALGADRLIGMLQPDPAVATRDPVAVYSVGCAGRIVAFNETDDGRLLINLQGVSRFAIREELPLLRGYRRVVPDWTPFIGDLVPEEAFRLQRERFRDGLGEYLERRRIRVDWDALDKMSDHSMVDFLSMHLPLAPEEKQALLQAPDPATRAETLLTITRMAAQVSEEASAQAGGTRH
jgi:Lon protease-like protein